MISGIKIEGLTTEEEFNAACEFMDSCISAVLCGCRMPNNDLVYDHLALYYKCKHYISAYNDRFKSEKSL